MDILKKRYENNKLKNLLKYENTAISKDKIINSEILLNTGEYSILSYNKQNNLIYPLIIDTKDSLSLFEIKTYNDNNIITDKIPREIFNTYLTYFFNFIKKNNIKGVVGRVLKTQNQGKYLYIGIHGVIVKIEGKCLEYFGIKPKKPALLSFYNNKKEFFFCENILQNHNKIIVKISRKKVIDIKKKIKNATI